MPVRDNPFTPGIKRTMASRIIGRGLGRVEVVTADTMIAFAAKAGIRRTADGTGSNSALHDRIAQASCRPGPRRAAFGAGRVRDDVVASTGGRQEPLVYGSLGGAEIATSELCWGAAPGPTAGHAPGPA